MTLEIGQLSEGPLESCNKLVRDFTINNSRKMSTEKSSRDVMVRLHLQGAPFVRADLAQYKPKTRASTVPTCMIEDDAIVEHFFVQEETQNVEQNFSLSDGFYYENQNQIIDDIMDMDENQPEE